MKNIQRMYVDLAKDFLSRKKRTNYYETIAIDEDQNLKFRYLHSFDDDTLQLLRELREKYGTDGFVNHLDEVFTDPDDMYELACNDKILEIDLDKPYHMYKFARHEWNGKSLIRDEVLVELPDKWYISLLADSIYDKDMNVNKLKYADKFLYDIVISEVDQHLCDEFSFYSNSDPYLITMDEIKEDAAQIFAEHPELCTTGTICYPFV